MSTRSSARNLFPPLDNPELTIQRRSRADPTLLNDFEMAAEGNGDPPVPDLRTMKELCQLSLNGRGGPIAPIAIHETNFGLKNDMIQQVQNSCQFHSLLAQQSESSSSITSSSDTEIAALKAEMAEINKNLMRVLQVNQQVKAITPNCETCGGPHSYSDCPATVGKTQNVYAAGAYQGEQPREKPILLGSFTWLKPTSSLSSTTLPSFELPSSGSSTPDSSDTSVVDSETEATKDTVHPTNNGSTKDVQPPVVQTKSPILNSEPVFAPIIEPVVAHVSAPKPNLKPSIPYPSRIHDQKLCDKANV
nr:reverse transcriptase domain-containing protein [Tanacetum cinerariifolium]